MPVHTVTSAIADGKGHRQHRPRGQRPGRGGGADHQAEHQQGAHDRHRHAGGQGHDQQEPEVHPAGDTPRASATSGIAEDSSSGRNMTMIAAMRHHAEHDDGQHLVLR